MGSNVDHPADSDQNIGLGMPKTLKLPGLIGVIVLVMLATIWVWVLTTSGYFSPKSLRIEQTNRLKQIGLALRIFDTDNPGQKLTNLNQLVASGYARPEALIDPLNGETPSSTAGRRPAATQSAEVLGSENVRVCARSPLRILAPRHRGKRARPFAPKIFRYFILNFPAALLIEFTD